MGVIRVLPDTVANQIAAGEVVERPAAVVKELVENSLDAGATCIEICIRGGGKQLIRVSDNGRGMDADDALLALERYATSKIQAASDLRRLRSFGFRGEALPSIASVSRFTLRTRPSTALEGTEIFIAAGKVQHVRACGAPEGTVVEAASLFHGVPARRQFLKTDRTESAHIHHLCRLFALAHPEVGFRLEENGRELFDCPPAPSLRERVRALDGRGATQRLREVWHEGAAGQLYGLLSAPGEARTTAREVAFFVNRRPVQSRLLTYALLEAYHTRLPKGRYPVALLFLEADPAQFDINVHPAKREVRFRHEAAVRRLIIEAVPKALQGDRPEEPAIAPAAASSGFDLREPEAPRERESPREPAARREGSRRAMPEPSRGEPGWRFIGLTQGNYALFDTSEGLVVLHPGAARARIFYEQLLAASRGEPVRAQGLLFPVLVELDARGAAALREALGFLGRHGFSVEPFGGGSFRLRAIPEGLDAGAAESCLRDYAAELAEEHRAPGSDPRPEPLARLLAGRAHREELTEANLQALVHALLGCRDPLTDPRGRPTFFELSKGELARRFQRA